MQPHGPGVGAGCGLESHGSGQDHLGLSSAALTLVLVRLHSDVIYFVVEILELRIGLCRNHFYY